MTKQELYDKADYYKSLIDKKRPFSQEKQTELEHYFRTVSVYNSNVFDGSILSLHQVEELLEQGISEDQKRIEAYEEAAGYAKAYDYMLTIARAEELELTEVIIKRLHYLCYDGMEQRAAGQYRELQEEVTGMEFLPPKPEDIPHFMGHFINQMQTSKRLMHPIEYAAICHKRLLEIHPFKEGNERTARLLMNLILENAGYGITLLPLERRAEYNKALVLSQRKNIPDIDPLITIILECVIESEKEYCKILGIE